MFRAVAIRRSGEIMIKTRKVLLVSFATVSLAALSACGGGGSSEKTDTAAATNTSTETAAANTTEAAGNATAGTATASSGAPAADDVTTLDGKTFASLTGDATKGEAVFVQCKTCHVTDPGQNRIGPSLHNVVGRKAGSVEGYQYSAANKGSGITWTKEKLFQYLEKPQRVVPGTKMAFAGIPDAQKRADVIAYLATK
jgi:cytochrome c